jgi:hypothetical protein
MEPARGDCSISSNARQSSLNNEAHDSHVVSLAKFGIQPTLSCRAPQWRSPTLRLD